jgi:hypothetical protein
MLGDSFSLIKNLITHGDLKGLLLLVLMKSVLESNEPLALSSFSLVLSHEVWKALHVTITGKKKRLLLRDIIFKELKKDDSVHMSSQENKHSLERYLLASVISKQACH